MHQKLHAPAALAHGTEPTGGTHQTASWMGSKAERQENFLVPGGNWTTIPVLSSP